MARISPLEPAPLDEEQAIERLLAQPWITGGSGELRRDIKPVKLRGRDVLLSDIVLEMRD